MIKYRIKEFKAGSWPFKVYRKKWFFWKCVQEYSYGGYVDRDFRTLAKAEDFIREEMAMDKRWKDRNAVLNVRDYPPNKV